MNDFEFALIGIDRNLYGAKLIKQFVSSGLKPSYIICETEDTSKLLLTQNELHKYGVQKETFQTTINQRNDEKSFDSVAQQYNIPVFWVQSHHCHTTKSILLRFPIDILLLTVGPIIRGDLLYYPRLFVLNVHAAPLPQYRGNWATYLACYHSEIMKVSAHIVTDSIDSGPIICTQEFCIDDNYTLETQLSTRSLEASVECASSAIELIMNGKVKYKMQRKWEGHEWRGRVINNFFYPAMSLSMQRDLFEKK